MTPKARRWRYSHGLIKRCRRTCWPEITGGQACAGHVQRARWTAWAIVVPDSRWEAEARIAGAVAKRGRYHRANILAHFITEPYWQADALVQIAEALASSGDYPKAQAAVRHAEATARAITSEWQQEKFQSGCREFRSPPGLTSRLMPPPADPDLQAEALTQAAKALASAGHYQQADATARAITNPGRHADALAQIAQALARAGHSRQARRAAAACCSAGPLTTAAGPAIILDSSAFAVLALVMAHTWNIEISG